MRRVREWKLGCETGLAVGGVVWSVGKLGVFQLFSRKRFPQLSFNELNGKEGELDITCVLMHMIINFWQK